MIYDIAINDMPRGWRTETELNKRIYQTWHNMIKRCYSEKEHERNPTYKDCYVCDKWLRLSGFVEDIVKIDGYELYRDNPNNHISLDKDIKSDNNNKCYCLEQCIFVTNEENSKQAVKYKDYTYIKEMDKTYCSRKINQYDSNLKLLNTYNSTREAERETGISHKLISSCCQYWEMDCNRDKWLETHNYNPNKSAGKDKNGNKYIWKYYKG